MVAAWMIEAKTIANGLRLASGCLADARTLVQSGSRNAAYLAEQCLEQIVRSLATSEGLHIERHDAHQLDKVIRRFPDDHPEKEGTAWSGWKPTPRPFDTRHHPARYPRRRASKD